jgi:chorismate synthase
VHFEIRPFASHSDREQCVDLQELIWGAGYSDLIPPAILLVMQKLGGVTAGAFADDGKMLGFVAGLTGPKDGALVHWSDMLAVHPSARGHQIGERLKQFQREHCQQLGIATIHWTYDPLLARNAHLNLNRLGARAAEYVEAMYGESTNSSFQGDMPTDRFVISWAVNPADLAQPLTEIPHGTPLVVNGDADELPLLDAPAVAMRVPRDISELVQTDLALARRWRFATRRAITHYFNHGYRVVGFVADSDGGRYLFAKANS